METTPKGSLKGSQVQREGFWRFRETTKATEWQWKMVVPGNFAADPAVCRQFLSKTKIPIDRCLQTTLTRHLKTYTALHPHLWPKKAVHFKLSPWGIFFPVTLYFLSFMIDKKTDKISFHLSFHGAGISILQMRKQAHRSWMICLSCKTSKWTSQDFMWGPWVPPARPRPLRLCSVKCGLQTGTSLQAGLLLVHKRITEIKRKSHSILTEWFYVYLI